MGLSFCGGFKGLRVWVSATRVYSSGFRYSGLGLEFLLQGLGSIKILVKKTMSERECRNLIVKRNQAGKHSILGLAPSGPSGHRKSLSLFLDSGQVLNPEPLNPKPPRSWHGGEWLLYRSQRLPGQFHTER